MGNICDLFLNREKKKERAHIVTPCYIQEDIESNTKGITVQLYPRTQVINHNPNEIPVVIYANQNPIGHGFTPGLLG